MTPDRAEAPQAMPSPADPTSGTPAQRRRFAAGLVVFGVWVAFLAVLATRAEPPDPGTGAKPGEEPPAATPRDADPTLDESR